MLESPFCDGDAQGFQLGERQQCRQGEPTSKQVTSHTLPGSFLRTVHVHTIIDQLIRYAHFYARLFPALTMGSRKIAKRCRAV